MQESSEGAEGVVIEGERGVGVVITLIGISAGGTGHIGAANEEVFIGGGREEYLVGAGGDEGGGTGGLDGVDGGAGDRGGSEGEDGERQGGSRRGDGCEIVGGAFLGEGFDGSDV